MARRASGKSALQEPARKLLGQEAGLGNADDPAVGAARASEKLSAHFANLIGSAGMHALFDRSLALVRVEYPWLAAAIAAPTESRWTRLQVCMDAQDPAVANEAAVELVATLLALVGRFIGDELVARLLTEIWPDLFPEGETK
jgi:hypothetical protein